MSHQKYISLMKGLLLFGLIVYSASSSVVVSQKSVALTIYKNNFGMVKDVRDVYFEQGESDLSFSDVSPNIQTQTVTIKPVQADTTKIFQQSLVNNQLSWRVWSDKVKVSPCQIVYRTTGFAWSVDYTLNLNQQETKAELGAWVMIQNNSDKKYQNAKIKLVSGNINTLNNNYQQSYQRPGIAGMAFMAAAPLPISMPQTPTFTESQLSDFQAYSLSRLINLTQSGRKQVQFIPKIYNISVKKIYTIQVSNGDVNPEEPTVKSSIQVLNEKKNKLGRPIPAGVIRVHKQDSLDNSIQFIGESRISHIAPGETLKLEIGNANDIIVKKTVKEFTKIDEIGSFQSTVSVKITNRKQVSADVIVNLKNRYGDNLKLDIGILGIGIMLLPTKISSYEYRWTKTVQAGKDLQFEWRQSYIAPKPVPVPKT